MSRPQSGIHTAWSARLDTVGRRRRRRAATAVRSTGLDIRHGRAINCRPAAIGTARPVRSIGPVRPVWPIGPIRSVGPIRAPWPVRSPWSVRSMITIPPVVFAPRPIAIVIGVDTCTQRRHAKKERQRASEPDHVCDFPAVVPPVICPLSIAPALRLVRTDRGIFGQESKPGNVVPLRMRRPRAAS